MLSYSLSQCALLMYAMTANAPTAKEINRLKKTRIFPTAVMALSPFGAGAVPRRPFDRPPPSSRPRLSAFRGVMPDVPARVNHNWRPTPLLCHSTPAAFLDGREKRAECPTDQDDFRP